MPRYESRPHGLMLHHFHGGRHPVGQGSISGEQFAAIIDFVGRDRILPAAEWLQRAVAGRLKHGDLCITFDDNLRCQFDVAYPVMHALGITGFWFTYTSVMEGTVEKLEIYRLFRGAEFATIEDFYAAFLAAVLSSEFGDQCARALDAFDPSSYLAGFDFYTEADRQFRYLRDDVLGPRRYEAIMDGLLDERRFDIAGAARELWLGEAHLRRLHGEGHVIGLHSSSHPTQMGALPAERQAQEYGTNYDYLVRLLGEPVLSMAHPCNSYNADTLQVLRRLGVRIGFRANMVTRRRFGPYELPRQDHANILTLMSAPN